MTPRQKAMALLATAVVGTSIYFVIDDEAVIATKVQDGGVEIDAGIPPGFILCPTGGAARNPAECE